MTARTAQAMSNGTIAALVAADGAACDAYLASLRLYESPMRDLADAIHCLCAVHGNHPGIVDLALRSVPAGDVRDWLLRCVAGFAVERGYIATLTAAVGPLPSTPGQAETDAALITQRHALDMLANSERAGVAIGAAVALILDWPAIRAVLDHVAERAGLSIEAMILPRPAATLALIADGDGSGPAARAMRFGAQQMLAQHRALWQILEARSGARLGR